MDWPRKCIPAIQAVPSRKRIASYDGISLVFQARRPTRKIRNKQSVVTINRKDAWVARVDRGLFRTEIRNRGMHEAYALQVVCGVIVFGPIASHENDARPSKRVDRSPRVTRCRSRKARIPSRACSRSSGPNGHEPSISTLAISQHTNRSTQTPASTPGTSSSCPSAQS
jgi:hypothetical protein